eukprot:TRINITY_DN26015_c0_g1_i1.p1 TRINITY_DN26015_c0_g1~~TRINITY_DN26015_c0_g1_i1.p1  ORF type:complete len:637 (+),score=171.23 TRINITY_DN26015_c0_g1_i1:26-1936(+)
MFVFLIVLAGLGLVTARPEPKKHFSKKVDVRIEETDDTTIVVIGNLEVHVIPRDDLIEASVTRNISDVVLEHLAGSLFTGVVKERRDCAARMFIKESQLISGNIDCKRKHFVIERIEKHYVMHKKPQRPHKMRSGKEDCPRHDQQFCTLFIQTDPYFWKHIRAKHETARLTREAILRMMVGHVMAANEFYEKYQFSGANFTHPGLQFILAGFQIDDDSLCEDVNDYDTDEVDYEGDLYEYGDYPVYDLDEEDYQYEENNYEVDDNFINDEEYNDWNETEEGYDSILDMFRDPFNKSSVDISENKSSSSVDLSEILYGDEYDYDDEDFNYEDAYKEDDAVILNGENCYEDINGTINTSTEFCKPFGIHESTLFLNMFSTVDHSMYCLAHIWTYRDMEVVGLADNPTEGAIGLSGYCAEYDPECHIGFNTGLVSFRHLGNQLSLADSQETFMHELGHSFGAAHDPKEDDKCAPGGKQGNYLMYPGPLGNSFIRREFSPCSMFEIGKVLDETEHSCLLTRNQVDGDVEIEKDTVKTEKTECEAETVHKQLTTVGTYLVDLKHYVEDKKKTKVLFRINRKFKQILRGFENKESFDNKRKISLKLFLKDVNSSLKNLADELEVFLARKISKLSKSIVKCAQ